MARRKVRSQAEVVERCTILQDGVRSAVDSLPEGGGQAAVVDAVWRAEALGTLLWSLQLSELESYDEPFDPITVASASLQDGELRPEDELELELESARLWHWRARTAALNATGALPLPERYASVDQLVAATAMRGFEEGLLPAPLRGDFPAYGKVYRQLAAPQRAEAFSIAFERHHALSWLCGEGRSWEDVPLDT
jgi:hypothetical protein